MRQVNIKFINECIYDYNQFQFIGILYSFYANNTLEKFDESKSKNLSYAMIQMWVSLNKIWPYFSYVITVFII